MSKSNGVSTSDINLKVPGTPPKADVPLSVQSIITQTDASGRQQRLAAPVYDNSQDDADDPPLPLFQRIFSCCRQKQRPNPPPRQSHMQATVSTSSSSSSRVEVSNTTPTTVANNTGTSGVSLVPFPSSPSRGRPAKYPSTKYIDPKNVGKKCLALDLDETLVHSSFQPVSQAHYVIPVTIEGVVHNVFVIKRPGVDEFMRRLSEHYEIIIYTASLSKYADPLLDKLDIHKVISNRLFRENCVFHDGHYVKDMSLISRDLRQSIIVDNSPMSYIFHPENAIDCSSFIDDPSDVEMWQIADFLIGIKDVEDVRLFCRHWREWCRTNPSSVPSSP